MTLASVVGINGLLLFFFYNRFWYAPDEGNYAHVAQRMLNGEILNLQIQDVHAGYINFINAAALALFGSDLISMRYPLALIAFGQAILIFALFQKSGRHKLAALASFAMSALGVIQFINPTSNWYCLFLAVSIVSAMEWIPKTKMSRLLIVGFLLGTLTLFRQLSGILVSIGVLAYLLIETKAERSHYRNLILGKGLIALMTFGLGWYLLRATDSTSFILFGICPLMLLALLWTRTTTENRQVLRIITTLGVGAIIAVSPLVLYHLLNDSLGAWLNDSVLSAVSLTKLSFIDQKSYRTLAGQGFYQFVHPGSFGEFLNGLYWAVLPLLAFLNGIAVLRFLGRDRELNRTTYALPILSIFYALVSVHYQIPIYLYYTVSLSLVSLLWILPTKSKFTHVAISSVMLLSGVAVYYHAAQPLSRISSGLHGPRTIFSLSNAEAALPRATLKIESEEQLRYIKLMHVIERETKPEETIFAFPSNAELYFLSGRRNPFRFYNTALGVRNEAEFQRVREIIVNDPPKLVIFRPDDKYNTSYSQEIIKLVKERYIFLGETSGFEIYRVQQGASLEEPT